MTHLLKLLDNMCKYEMDPMSIVEDTERTLFCPQTDRRMDGQMDRQTDGQGETSMQSYHKHNNDWCTCLPCKIMQDLHIDYQQGKTQI